MSFERFVIEPSEVQQPDTLVMYPFPIGADIQDTGSRLQALADNSGIPIIASDLFLQKKKTIFDMSARKANQPEGQPYVSMSKRRAEFYLDAADEFGIFTRVGFGDSAAVSAIQGMQLYGEVESVFDAVLLRDGWNLEPETTTFKGIRRYLKYQLEDAKQLRESGGFDIPETTYDTEPVDVDEVGRFAKLRNMSDLLKGNHNRQNAVLLASMSHLAMHTVTLTNGLSSSNTVRLREFGDELRHARAAQHDLKHVRGLIAKQYPGWHSDLMDPRRGARDLLATLELLQEV